MAARASSRCASAHRGSRSATQVVELNESYALPGLAAALAAGMMLQGGYYGAQYGVLAALLALTLVASGARRMPLPLGSAVLVLVVALLAAAAANGWPSASVKPIATAAIATMALIAARSAAARDGRQAVLDLLVAAATIAAVLGIVGVAFHLVPLALREHPWRLQSTLTYQNAAGALFAMALPSALERARGSWLARGAPVLIGIGLIATLSRGAILAAGAAVLIYAAGGRARALWRPAAGIAVGAASLVPSMLDIEGGAAIATVGVAVGLAVAVHRSEPGRARRVVVMIAVVAVAGGAVASISSPIRGRLALSSTDRTRVWRETIRRVPDHLWFGTGPGTYSLTAVQDGRLVHTRYAHNEYLQALSETGVAGMAAIVAAMVLIGIAAARARPRDGLWRAAVAGSVAFGGQAGVEFLWRFPALVAFCFVLVAVATMGNGIEASNQTAWQPARGDSSPA